ncbi:MAG: Mur ligase family protein [Acidimicrobiales bacterium]
MTQAVVYGVSGICVIAMAPALLRWLRVAQREHYLPDATSRFALRWWTASPANIALILVGCAGVALSARFPFAALASAVVAIAGPAGLPIKGRTSPLGWTRRLKTLATISVLIGAALFYLGIATGHAPLAGAALDIGACVLVDIGCYLAHPLEKKLSQRYVNAAHERLAKVNPRVVAITGSYGKTSTKLYTDHLSSGCYRTLPSPASFNNRAGLARTINEQLLDSTEVFVAEMGTYGPGEIREMCSWLVPEISVITAIGPVHLERFKSEDRILQAKSEITESASTVVLQVDDARLEALARQLENTGKRVIRCSSIIHSDQDYTMSAPGSSGNRLKDHSAGIAAGGLEDHANSAHEDRGSGGSAPDIALHASVNAAAYVVTTRDEATGLIQVNIDGREVASKVATDAQPTNISCAVGAALALGCPEDMVAERLHTVTSPSHRLGRIASEGHPVVLDDTYNSNPAGCMAALARLKYDQATGRRVLVTPGMVELGSLRHKENAAFASTAAGVADVIIVVGRTNRKALLAGIAQANSQPEVITANSRDRAVSWVRDNLGDQDVVLYENDLPDHYP